LLPLNVELQSNRSMADFATPRMAWTRFLPTPSDGASVVPVASAHAGQSVLVTGAGGYIGSALVKAIAAAGPSRIVLLDSAEHNLFQILQHLESSYGQASCEGALCEPVLGSVDDGLLLDDIFARFQPEVVYHAAALKHVPLLERNPIAAVRNNAIGTYTLAQAALRHGTPKLILISTDKAVNPHSVMGVSKRLAELAVLALSRPACRMNAIRLVNVIGSPGSVVPIFLSQIAERKPVTVTHPEATRWFMSLNEAVHAVLACGTAEMEGKDIEGRILVPELAPPTRIVDLAKFLVGAAAEDSIVFTGCRPGDKLTEEITLKHETKEGIVHGPLEVYRTCRLELAELQEIIEQLSDRIAARDVPGLILALVSVVPEYVPSGLLR
jgi:FlaA1/EpsC-like NDP-sugar epimerase